MNDKKFIIIITLISLILIGGGIVVVDGMSKSAAIPVDEEAVATTQDVFHDWGEIDIEGGNVEATFEISNTGKGTLQLYGIKTSCMCTTAQLLFKGDESPVFGMHTKSSYNMGLPARETAQLRVVFDPAYHGPNGIGDITRQVTIKTNDPANPELSFTVKAKVTKKT